MEPRHPTRDFHPARATAPRPTHRRRARTAAIPRNVNAAQLDLGGKRVALTNLLKPFWPELGVTKGDLIGYYAALAHVLLPHIRDRAMVMKRYPHGASGEFFFMKRAPTPRPEWIHLCSIAHESHNIIDFPVINDLASLLWLINLGCIDLNPWYARCDDVDRPDYMHFDLDPVKAGPGEPQVPWERVQEAALIVRDTLAGLNIRSYAKTSGSRGIHVYVPIERGPTQKQVWTVAKGLAVALASKFPRIITAQYRVAKRPKGRVLVDYNQNAWGRTLASVYSVRPTKGATVSTPVTWEEIERGVKTEDFTIFNVPARVKREGDLFKPLLLKRGRLKLEAML